MYCTNPFTHPGVWYRGNLHAHSTISDGQRSPADVIAWYRGHGYDFLALTDHDRWAPGAAPESGFLVLSGIEIDGTDPTRGIYHLVGLGLPGPIELNPHKDAPAQAAIDLLRGAGGVVFMAHPYWSNQLSANLVGLEGCIGLEVYNGGCDVMCGKGFAAVHWDDLLARGCRWWGLAVDDSHWFPGYHDVGLGWVWVKSPELSQTALLTALVQGHFYASTGPRIHSVEFTGHEVYVRCSPAACVDFIGAGRYARRVAGYGAGLTEATHVVDDRQRYVRVACYDAQGHCAWSNPIFLEA